MLTQLSRRFKSLFTLVSICFYSKSFGQLLDISPKNVIFIKATVVWFTDQNSKPLDIEDQIKTALLINSY